MRDGFNWKELKLGEEDKLFLGVISGLTKEFNLEYDLNLARIVFVLLMILLDIWIGIVLYFAVYIVMKHNQNRDKHLSKTNVEDLINEHEQLITDLSKEDIYGDNLAEDIEELNEDDNLNNVD